MSERALAIIFAGIGAVSLCATCAFGPAALGAAVGWAFGWVIDLGPMASNGVAISTALAAYALFRRWGAVKPRGDSESPALLDVTDVKN